MTGYDLQQNVQDPVEINRDEQAPPQPERDYVVKRGL